MSLARYLRTIRHLRPVQIYGRLWQRIYRPSPDLRPAPRQRAREITWPGPPLRQPSLVGRDHVRLLGVEQVIGAREDWQHGHSALWHYNQHYFDDLNAADDANRAVWQSDLIRRWTAENPPGHGVGWDPYPTSLRVVSWIRWILRGHDAPPGMVESLAVQVRHLRRRLEHHLLGNHLFVNAKALLFAGAFFTGPEAEGWLGEGHRLLARELAEQILPDGGHFERSPMYHALILEDVLDLLALARVYPGTIRIEPELREPARRMRRWLRVMTHPDGEIALFNDATLGIAASPAALEGYAARLELGLVDETPAIVDLEASGYTRVERGGAVLFADTGEIGPGYLPGHAHADTLSFELSIDRRRVVSDSGVSEYGVSAERLRQRGTAAHNTAVVDDEDSSEVWSGFRVGRRAHVHGRRLDTTGSRITLRACHDGYAHLGVSHARTWSIDDDSITIDDEVRGRGHHRVEVFLHLGHGVIPQRLDNRTWSLGDGVSVETGQGPAWSCRRGTLHPAMGAQDPAWMLVARVVGDLPIRVQTRIRWR